jgi:hypothetical protein
VAQAVVEVFVDAEIAAETTVSQAALRLLSTVTAGIPALRQRQASGTQNRDLPSANPLFSNRASTAT